MPKGVYERKPRPPKTYPPELVERVRTLYAEGMTQGEVARTIGTTQKVVYRLMLVHEIPRRPAIKRDQWGPANTGWKGPQAGYQAMHLRVYRMRGTPKPCSACGTSNPRKTYDWANLTGNYNDPMDYAAMCRSCHRTFDNRKEVMPPSS